MSFSPKNPLVMDRSLKVQRLSIPFKITHSATAANVAIACDEPSIAFFKTAGNDQITAALDSGDTATYSVGPTDSSGTFNILVKAQQGSQEAVGKVCRAVITDRVNGGELACKLGSSTGLSTKTAIMLTGSTSVNLTTTDLDGCLVVEYTISES